MLFNDKKEYICFIILICFSCYCSFKMMDFCLSGSILTPDVSLYLISALKYAGLDYYNIAYPGDLFFSPIISGLTSIIFRLGFVDKDAIIIVTSVFSLLSFFGLYILLKNRFNSLLSLTGVIIYGSLSIIIFNLSRGLVDIPLISISMWVLVFAIMAIDKNPKYFLIAFPLLTIAFFVKYMAGFILPLIVLYYLINRNFLNVVDCLIYDRKLFKQKANIFLRSNEFKYLLISFMISLVLGVLICKFLILDYGGSLIFFDWSVSTFNGSSLSQNAIDYNNVKSFYFYKLSDILFEKQSLKSIFSIIIYGILGFGLIFYLINLFKSYDPTDSKKDLFKTKYFSLSITVIFIISILFAFVGFKFYSNHMITNILLLISFVILYSFLQKFGFGDKNRRLDILFLAYIVINFVFISLYQQKVFRYALPFIPPLIYFVVLGLDSILNYIKIAVNKNDLHESNDKYIKLTNLIPIIIIVIFLFSTVTFIEPMEIERSNDVYYSVLYKGFVNDLEDACNFINSNDEDYHLKTFASYNHHSRTIRWYLNVNVTILDEKDPNLYNFNETDYMILNENKIFKNYNMIQNNGDFYIYRHI